MCAPLRLPSLDDVFGHLQVTDLREQRNARGRRLVECKCLLCGNQKSVEVNDLLSGHTKSCGCRTKPALPQIGDTFGKRQVTDLSERRDRRGRRLVGCRCNCGNPDMIWVDLQTLRRDRKSCGCSRRKDVAMGQQFGRLTTVEWAPKRPDGQAAVVCECNCTPGSRVVVPATRLRSGRTRSCGCLSPELSRARKPRLILLEIGQRFGRLVVLGLSDRTDSAGRLLWECRCDCGNLVLATTKALTSGKKKSCGCLVTEMAMKHLREHLPTPKEQRRRYREKWEITDKEGRAWYSLLRAAQILGVKVQQVLLWAEECAWLDGLGIETCEFTDGLGREVPYYSQEDVDMIAEERRIRKPVPAIRGYTPLIEVAKLLKTSVRNVRKQLKRIDAKVARPGGKRGKRGKRKDGRPTPRSYVANGDFVKLKELNAARLRRLRTLAQGAGNRVAERNKPIYETCATVYARVKAEERTKAPDDRYLMADAVAEVESVHGETALGGEYATLDDKKRRLRYNAQMWEKLEKRRNFEGGRN